MKIILIQDVKSLGKAGDIKDVSDGYARNFLFPRKLAETATPEAVKKVEEKKAREKSERETHMKKLQALAESLKNKQIILSAQGKGGKLFGSITAKQIAEELQKENFDISPNSVIMKGAIKKVGKYEIEIRLEDQIKTHIQLEIEQK